MLGRRVRGVKAGVQRRYQTLARRATSRAAVVNSHGPALSGNHVLDRGRNRLGRPQVSRAAVACPPLSIRRIEAVSVQASAGVGLERIHDALRAIQPRYDGVKVTILHMGRAQCPSPPRASLGKRLKDTSPAAGIQGIRPLGHAAPIGLKPTLGRRQIGRPGHVVRAVGRLARVAVEPCAVARESDEIGLRHGAMG